MHTPLHSLDKVHYDFPLYFPFYGFQCKHCRMYHHSEELEACEDRQKNEDINHNEECQE